MNYRPLINKIFTRKYQFALQPAAVEFIESIFQDLEIEDEDEAQTALETMAKECQKQEGSCDAFTTASNMLLSKIT